MCLVKSVYKGNYVGHTILQAVSERGMQKSE